MHNPYYRGPVSDHFDGARFFNPGIASTDKTLDDIRRWRKEGRRVRWTPGGIGLRAVPPQRSQAIRVTMVGHAGVLIQVAEKNILVDPIWSQRASPVSFAGPKRFDPPGVARRDLPPIDAVLVSHNHYDHLDLPTLRRLQADHAPRFVVPLGNDTLIRRAVRGAVVSTGDWHDELALGNAIDVVIWPAYHWSSRWLRDRRMALWCGFVLRTPQGVVYVVGDTAYGDGAPFRAVAARFGAAAVAIIPIGAYEPRWFMRAQHVDPEESVRIAQDCGAVQSLGVHWGTFQLTDEARNEPAERLSIAAAAAGLHDRFLALRPGDVWTPFSRRAAQRPNEGT